MEYQPIGNNIKWPIGSGNAGPDHEAFKRFILDERDRHLRDIERKPFSYVPPMWGVSMQEVANALIGVFGQRSVPAPEPIGDSSDGIEPCGYDAL